jgi:hypothetical protein
MYSQPSGYSCLNPLRSLLKQCFDFSGRRRRQKCQARRCVFSPRLEVLEDRITPSITPSTYDWIGASKGDWKLASNWFDENTNTTASAAPGPIDTAQIGLKLGGVVTVNVSDSEAAAFLNITNGSTLSVQSSGTFTLDGSGNSTLVGTINNFGNFVQSQSGTSELNLGSFSPTNAAGTINNERGGLWNIKVGDNPNLELLGTGSSFNNAGVFEDSASVPTAFINAPFNNNIGPDIGTVSAASGTVLDFEGGGSWTGGTFTPDTGAVIKFTASTTSFTGTYTGTGTGNVEFAGNVVIGSGGATLDFRDSGMFQWVGGVIDANTNNATLTNDGFMTFAGIGNVTLLGTLSNNGTFLQSGNFPQGAPRVIDLGYGSISGVIDNQGTWDIATGANANLVDQGGASSAFNNTATFEDSDAFDPAIIDVPFNNSSGTINALDNSGGGAGDLLNFEGGGTWAGGSFTPAANATVEFTNVHGSPTLSFTGNYTGSGAGSVEFNGLEVIGSAGATFSLPSGMFQWISGTIDATADAATGLTNAGFMAFSGTANVTLLGILTNTDAFFQSSGVNGVNAELFLGSGNTAGTIDNENGATWDITTGDNPNLLAVGTGSSFNNAGTFEDSATNAAAIVNVPVTNEGTINAFSGTVFEFASGYIQSAGTTIVDGLFQVGTGTQLRITGGTVNGTGTIQGNVQNTGGTFSPGDAGPTTGILTINGPYTQASGGFLSIRLGGTTQGTQYDLLNVNGNVSLNGTLNVNFVNGFTPLVGNSFQVLKYASRTGTFSTMTGPAAPFLTAQYYPPTSDNSLVLSVQPGPVDHLVLSVPATATAGTAFSFTVTALDQFNNNATGYTGTVHFTKSDSGAGSAVPGDYTFVAGDNGVHTFTNGATLVTAGSQTITGTDGSITGTSAIVVNAAAASHFSVSVPATATAGTAFSFTVAALDQFNNNATGYTGTVHFTKSDSGAGSAVPGDYTFVAGDHGVHTFTNGATLVTAGSQTITGTAGSLIGTAGSLIGTSGAIVVSVAPATTTWTTLTAALVYKVNKRGKRVGKPVTVYKATVTSAAGIPTGGSVTLLKEVKKRVKGKWIVRFVDVWTIPLGSDGTVTFPLKLHFSEGTKIYAVYSGDTQFAKSQSPVFIVR